MTINFSATIEPKGWTCDAPPGLTLLAAAEQAGIRLPSSCRNGTCRTCLCRLVSGQVHYNIDWPGVSLDERRAGDILPCVAYPDSDVVLAVGGATRRPEPA